MLSVITPTLNAEAYIQACLRNVIAQDCYQIEHIIIDGASTDGTMAIVQGYAAKYPHIRWVSEPDQGQSDAMNKGIRLAKGDVIGFLNVDDYYQPNVLKKAYALFQRLSEPSFLVANCIIWDQNGEYLAGNKPAGLSYQRMLLGHSFQPFPANPSAYFYHRSLHDLIGEYDSNDHYSMDVDILFRLTKAAHVYYVNEHWGNHRMIPGSKTYGQHQVKMVHRRMENITKKYQKMLPSVQHYWVSFAYMFFKLPIMTQLLYFYRYPEEFIPRLSKRLAKIGLIR